MARSVGLPKEQLIGKTDFDFFPQALAEQYIADERALFASGQAMIGKEEPTIDPASGEPWWTLTSKMPLRDQDGTIVGLVGIGLDLTERKRLEQDLKNSNAELLALNNKLTEAQSQLLQSEKMASVGQLAAGVAHEINNPIGFVKSNLGSLKVQVQDLLAVIDTYEKAIPALTDKSDLLANIEMAKSETDFEFLRGDIINLINESLDGVQRVKTIVENLKDFSRVDTSEWQYANLEKGLESTLSIVWNEIKYKADVVKEYAGVPEIECIASQVNQVFMNLLINAAQAIETHGTITVRTGFDEDLVWVEIEDTGTGIRPEHLTKIFDPFFTTKPVGKGTGLGLSLAYGIANRHHGRLTVSSEIHKGTVFRLSLPRERVNDEERTKGVRDE
jgi:PAS domain S-box-containing protein